MRGGRRRNRPKFDVLSRLGNVPFGLVFVTAYNQYAVQAFEFSAVHYLLKPVDPLKLIRAVEKVREHRQLQQAREQYDLLLEVMQSKKLPSLNNRVAFSTQEEIVFAALKDIIRIDADQNCSSI